VCESVSDQVSRQTLWLLIFCLEIRTISEHFKQRIREVVKSSCNWSMCFFLLYTCTLTQRKFPACCPVAHERFIFKQLWLLCMNERTLPRICHYSLLSYALPKKLICEILWQLTRRSLLKEKLCAHIPLLFRPEIVGNNSSLKMITLKTLKTWVLCIIYMKA